MTNPANESQDPGRGDTLRGAFLILAIGLALGIGYNAIGRASRPARGLAWIKPPETAQSLEALQAAGGAADSGATMPSTAGDSAAAPEAGSAGDASPAASGRTESSSGLGAPAAAAPPAGDVSHAHAESSPEAASAPDSSRAPASPPVTAAPVIPDVPGPLKLEIAALKRLYDAKAALILDAREAEEYAGGHIAGALSLPYNDAMADPERVKGLVPGERAIVVYCSGGICELSMDLAKLLVRSGKRKVLVYEGGYPEWQTAGYPVAQGANPGERP